MLRWRTPLVCQRPQNGVAKTLYKKQVHESNSLFFSFNHSLHRGLDAYRSLPGAFWSRVNLVSYWTEHLSQHHSTTDNVYNVNLKQIKVSGEDLLTVVRIALLQQSKRKVRNWSYFKQNIFGNFPSDEEKGNWLRFVSSLAFRVLLASLQIPTLHHRLNEQRTGYFS